MKLSVSKVLWVVSLIAANICVVWMLFVFAKQVNMGDMAWEAQTAIRTFLCFTVSFAWLVLCSQLAERFEFRLIWPALAQAVIMVSFICWGVWSVFFHWLQGSGYAFWQHAFHFTWMVGGLAAVVVISVVSVVMAFICIEDADDEECRMNYGDLD